MQDMRIRLFMQMQLLACRDELDWMIKCQCCAIKNYPRECCVVILFILDVRVVDASAGVAQEKGHTEFLHLPSAVLALIFIARRIQPSLSLVDREVKFCVPTN